MIYYYFIGLNALPNFNIRFIQHRKNPTEIWKHFNRFLSASHFTEWKENQWKMCCFRHSNATVSENPIIESLENRFLDCVNNHFYGSINLCKLKNDWFQCVATMPHKDQKCMIRFSCGGSGGVLAICKSNSTTEPNYIIFNWNCWASLSLLCTRTINTMNKHSLFAEQQLCEGMKQEIN